MMVIANVFPKLQTMKIFLGHSIKTADSENALKVNM